MFHRFVFLNLFVSLFLVTPCLVVAVQPCIELISIKKKVNQTGNTQYNVFHLGKWPCCLRCCK